MDPSEAKDKRTPDEIRNARIDAIANAARIEIKVMVQAARRSIGQRTRYALERVREITR